MAKSTMRLKFKGSPSALQSQYPFTRTSAPPIGGPGVTARGRGISSSNDAFSSSNCFSCSEPVGNLSDKASGQAGWPSKELKRHCRCCCFRLWPALWRSSLTVIPPAVDLRSKLWLHVCRLLRPEKSAVTQWRCATTAQHLGNASASKLCLPAMSQSKRLSLDIIQVYLRWHKTECLFGMRSTRISLSLSSIDIPFM